MKMITSTVHKDSQLMGILDHPLSLRTDGGFTNSTTDFFKGIISRLNLGFTVTLENGDKPDEDTGVSKLEQIVRIIKQVDDRCMASDGEVTSTLDEMTDEEMQAIYAIANNGDKL